MTIFAAALAAVRRHLPVLELVENWRDVARLAWSIRLNVLAAVLTGIEFAIPLFYDDPPIARGLFALVALLVSLAAAFARFVAQQGLSK